ncbi:MAG: hypothetical protein JXA96_17140 [Sedimentisphaerales bacterium]|nr:hypothetical protein [Sedimentisphaerales bacterium]
MKDWLHSILKVIDHERGKVIALILAVAIVFGVWGCEIKLTSPISDKKVTIEQFETEVQAKKIEFESKLNLINADMQQLLSNADITKAQFAKWQDFKTQAFDILAGVVTTAAGGGQVNIAQVVASLVGLGGVGMAVGGLYDSKRKNDIIDKTKSTVA